MYKRKVKLTHLLLFYDNGATKDVFYPGVISGKALMRKIARDPRVLVRRSDDGCYTAVQPSRAGLKSAVSLGYEVVGLETDPIKLICFSTQRITRGMPDGQGDTSASD